MSKATKRLAKPVSKRNRRSTRTARSRNRSTRPATTAAPPARPPSERFHFSEERAVDTRMPAAHAAASNTPPEGDAPPQPDAEATRDAS